MPRRWMPSEDIAVRLADALDAEDGGRRLLELARRLGRTEAAVRRRAWGLRADRLEGADLLVEPGRRRRPISDLGLNRSAVDGGSTRRH